MGVEEGSFPLFRPEMGGGPSKEEDGRVRVAPVSGVRNEVRPIRTGNRGDRERKLCFHGGVGLKEKRLAIWWAIWWIDVLVFFFELRWFS